MRFFIVFEGGEGSGKTTQARSLVRRLRRRGIPCESLREPGSTPVGEAIRRLLRSGKPLNSLAELMLFNASRTLLVEQRLRPALAQGRVVVCDRFVASTVAYQGFARQLSWTLVDSVNAKAMGGVTPTLNVLLDLPPEEGLKRIGAASDRFEDENLDFHLRVREGYLAQVRSAPDEWLVVDGLSPASEVSKQVWNHLRPILEF